MSNEVKLSDKATFTMVGLINVLTGFYDKLAEHQDEINDYLDVVEMAKDYAIDCYNSQIDTEAQG